MEIFVSNLPDELWMIIIHNLDQNFKKKIALICMNSKNTLFLVNICKTCYLENIYNRYPLIRIINKTYRNLNEYNNISKIINRYTYIYNHICNNSYYNDIYLIRQYVIYLMSLNQTKSKKIHNICYYIFVCTRRSGLCFKYSDKDLLSLKLLV